MKISLLLVIQIQACLQTSMAGGSVINGSWGGGITYVSANDATPGSLIFSFNDGPVSAVGGFINYFPDSADDLSITALDAGMNVLETFNITALADILTPSGFNDGAFRGIDRGIDDIAFFELTGSFPVLDDLTFTRDRAIVPEPSSLVMLTLVLAGVSFVGRKKLS